MTATGTLLLLTNQTVEVGNHEQFETMVQRGSRARAFLPLTEQEAGQLVERPPCAAQSTNWTTGSARPERRGRHWPARAGADWHDSTVTDSNRESSSYDEASPYYDIVYEAKRIMRAKPRGSATF
jgi:hypothetical protein